jgi:hypothetical protein
MKTNEVSLNLKYIIFDNKERRIFKADRLKKKNNLINKARDYYLKKDLINYLSLKLQFLNLKDNRLKIRIANGVKNLDDRLILIEEILILKKDISKTEIELQSLKAFLINNLVSNIKKLL